MATLLSDFSDFGNMESDTPWGDENGFEGGPPAATLTASPAPVPTPSVMGELEKLDAPKGLQEVRGFFIHGAEGLYDGATRDGEEPRESYFVDVQDYDTGELKRVWGVALRDAMAQSVSAHGLQPGSRIHLVQQGKKEMFVDSVNAKNELIVNKTYANEWQCTPDRGPLPSQLAHLMDGLNVDAMLDKIATRHDMGVDDPRLVGWKLEQKKMMAAMGEDPQTIRGWLNGQLVIGEEETRSLVSRAVELAGYGEADPVRAKLEFDTRIEALRKMSPERRFDYLMETSKPHLIRQNAEAVARIAEEVRSDIEKIAEIACPGVATDAPNRRALCSALAQSVEGLTASQQRDYLSRRRQQIAANVAAGIAQQAGATQSAATRVSLDKLIDAQGLTAAQYQELLEERLALATTPKEKADILQQETDERKARSEEARAALEPLEQLWQKIAAERDVDMLAYWISKWAGALARSVSSTVLPAVKTTFESIGGVSAWRKRGCESGLADLQAALGAAKSSPVYKAFENDPAVVLACGGKDPGETLAAQPAMAQHDAMKPHLAAQTNGVKDAARARPLHNGLWAGVQQKAYGVVDKLGRMNAANLVKGDGAVDDAWVEKMRSGMMEFSKNLAKTLMPDDVRRGLEEMIAMVLQSLRALFDAARDLVASRADKKAQPASMAMEP